MTNSSFRSEAILTIAAGVATVGAVLYVALPTIQILSSRLHLRLLQYKARKKQAGCTITDLHIYPCKSLRGEPLDSVVIGDRGFLHDRQYMLVSPVPQSATPFSPDDPTHRFLSQRQCPTLTQIRFDIQADNASAAGGGTITLSHRLDRQRSVTLSCRPESDAPIYSATVWGDVVRVQDMGDVVANFLRTMVENDEELSMWDKTKLRLVMQMPDDQRSPAPLSIPLAAKFCLGGSPRVSLADGFPLLIASTSSLDELNARLKAAGKEALPMSRFRPNIVIQGTEPFVEDQFKVLQIGSDVILHVVSSCPRCKESCTDQETGVVTAEPLATMQSFRQLSGENVYFAVNAIPAPGSTGKSIRVGDSVKVLHTGIPVWSEG